MDDNGETIGDNTNEDVIHNEATDDAIDIVANEDINPPDQNQIEQFDGNDEYTDAVEALDD